MIDKDKLHYSLGQYCEVRAIRGIYDYSYTVDMNPEKWDFKWLPEKYTLLLYPADIKAEIPATVREPEFICIADSISFDEDTTKDILRRKIPDLNMKVAEQQKKYVYSQAKEQIISHYRHFFQLIPNIKIERFPEIIVLFPHEKESYNKNIEDI